VAEDEDLLQPRRRYEAQGRIQEYDKIVTSLKRDRAATLNEYSGLDSVIRKAVS
jgi:hypothetical protein